MDLLVLYYIESIGVFDLSLMIVGRVYLLGMAWCNVRCTVYRLICFTRLSLDICRVKER